MTEILLTRPLNHKWPQENSFVKKVISLVSGYPNDANTAKYVLYGHSKIEKTKILITNGSLMKVESIVDAWSILQYFWPALSDSWSWKPIFGLFESGRFTQVLLYFEAYSNFFKPYGKLKSIFRHFKDFLYFFHTKCFNTKKQKKICLSTNPKKYWRHNQK